jgi:hypothetical protein
MSTKSSLAHGEHFHFYEECFDDQNVYLELENTEFEVSQTRRPNTKDFNGRVMVRIPLETWITIQQVKPPHMDLVGQSDQELLEMVQTDVDERIARYKAAITDRLRGLESMIGSFVYGRATESRSAQIRRGLAHVTKQRNKQHEILERSKTNWISSYATKFEQPTELPTDPNAVAPSDET